MVYIIIIAVCVVIGALIALKEKNGNVLEGAFNGLGAGCLISCVIIVIAVILIIIGVCLS